MRRADLEDSEDSESFIRVMSDAVDSASLVHRVTDVTGIPVYARMHSAR